jgi:hypothetical protein
MRRFLLVAFLFLSGGLSAQVDSFVVQGKTFKFEIPQDWVLEGKGNGIHDKWNLILRHNSESPQLYAWIGIKIEKRLPADSTPVKFKKHSKVEYGYTQMGSRDGAFFNIEFPSNECSNCKKEYTDINVYYLNSELDLVSFREKE